MFIWAGRAGILAVAIGAAGAAGAQTTDSLTEAISKGTPILELRVRYEDVQQSGRANDGEATTLRTRVGWQTGKWHDLQALVEFEDVRDLGAEHYDSGINGKSAYGQIFDPEVTELNRLQLSWKPSDAFTAAIGRQRINLGDQRFIGSVGWRQDEQTFDALRMDGKVGGLETTYIYIAHVNRIFAEAQDWGSDSHVLDASYTIAEPLKVGGFVYALDFDQPDTPAVRNQSSLTWGARASGRVKTGGVKLDYGLRWARQSDYGSSLLDYELDYGSADLTATFKQVSLRIGYERMEGNGARGFSTPLATLHAFNGWSDAFVANGVKTTVDGLRDLNATLTWNPDWKWGEVSGFSFLLRHHEFEADRTGAGLGEEWDASASGQLTGKLSWLVKYAHYDGPGTFQAPGDRQRVWLGLEWRL
jgi:hypothetical protein